jgi:chromosomal replication initiation ATPase DnaA
MSPRVSRILSDVSQQTNVAVDMLLSPDRHRPIAWARQTAMARIRALVNANGEPVFSYSAIGKIFGRDHTTVISGIKCDAYRNGARRLDYPLVVVDFEETRL